MNDKVVKFRTWSNPDDVLEQAVGAYSHVVIIGWNKDDGLMDARASTNMSNAEANYLIDQCKSMLLEVYDE